MRNEPVITSFEIILKCTFCLEMKCLYFDTLSIGHNFFKMLGLIYKIALLKEWQHVMANNVYAPNSKNTTIAIKQKKQTLKLLAYPEIETETSGNAVRWVNCRQLKVSIIVMLFNCLIFIHRNMHIEVTYFQQNRLSLSFVTCTDNYL